MLTFYFAPGPNSMAPCAKWACRSCRGRYRSRTGICPAEYPALNPEGKVRTLMIDGRPPTEVAVTQTCADGSL